MMSKLMFSSMNFASERTAENKPTAFPVKVRQHWSRAADQRKKGIEKMKKIVKEMLVLGLPLLFSMLMVAYWLVFGYAI